MAQQPDRAPDRAELMRAIERAETELRELGSRWANGLAPETRLRLLRVANRLLRLLIRDGRR